MPSPITETVDAEAAVAPSALLSRLKDHAALARLLLSPQTQIQHQHQQQSGDVVTAAPRAAVLESLARPQQTHTAAKHTPSVKSISQLQLQSQAEADAEFAEANACELERERERDREQRDHERDDVPAWMSSLGDVEAFSEGVSPAALAAIHGANASVSVNTHRAGATRNTNHHSRSHNLQQQSRRARGGDRMSALDGAGIAVDDEADACPFGDEYSDCTGTLGFGFGERHSHRTHTHYKGGAAMRADDAVRAMFRSARERHGAAHAAHSDAADADVAAAWLEAKEGSPDRATAASTAAAAVATAAFKHAQAQAQALWPPLGSVVAADAAFDAEHSTPPAEAAVPRAGGLLQRLRLLQMRMRLYTDPLSASAAAALPVNADADADADAETGANPADADCAAAASAGSAVAASITPVPVSRFANVEWMAQLACQRERDAIAATLRTNIA